VLVFGLSLQNYLSKNEIMEHITNSENLNIQTNQVQQIFKKICEIRGQKVMLDFDLAELYGVEKKVLNQAVKRNIDRFPPDFMFQLTKKEQITVLRSQIVTAKSQSADNQENLKSKFSKVRFLPYAFTEQGVAMLSSVLNSKEAIKINIAIMRAFVEVRKLFFGNQDLFIKVSELASKVGEHDQYIKTLYDYLKSFDDEQKRRIEWENRRPIGFVVRDEN